MSASFLMNCKILQQSCIFCDKISIGTPIASLMKSPSILVVSSMIGSAYEENVLIVMKGSLVVISNYERC